MRLLVVVALATPAFAVRLCVTSAHDLPQALDIWPKNPLPDAFEAASRTAQSIIAASPDGRDLALLESIETVRALRR